MGVEDILALNPPELEGHDEFVWRWFQENVSEFVHEFNLMPSLIEKLGLTDGDLSLFLMKMNMIYKHNRTISEKMRDQRSGGYDA